MKKFRLIFFLLSLICLNTFSQEKKILLRFDEISKSELDVKNNRYIERGKTKSLGTILVYSKQVVFYDEEKETFRTYEIGEVTEGDNGKRTFYISKSKEQSYIFALTKDNRYFTQIGKKNRFIYRIIDSKYAEE